MSIATYLTALDRDRDALAANLTTKGVPASSSETFTTLVPKVLDIPSGGGGNTSRFPIKSNLNGKPIGYSTPNPKTWTVKTWYLSDQSTFVPSGLNIWTDGTDIYYSNNATQYVLNKSTSTWETKTWYGRTSFLGSYIWTDGTDIYLSNANNYQYKLNKSTSTWESQSWNIANTYLVAERIWTDGTNTYLSYNSNNQFVFNKATKEWETKTWSGTTNIDGKSVWSDGSRILYSSGSSQYYLNGSTWTSVTWSGLSSFSGRDVWTDGVNLYVHSGTSSYILDRNATNKWVTTSWINFIGPQAQYIWTDGTNIYYSYSTQSFVLSPEDSTYSLGSAKTRIVT